MGSNWLLIVAQVGVTFFLTPYTIRMLGQGQYGAWLLVAGITSYLSMLALGIPMATVRFVAKYAGSEDVTALNRTVGTCAGLYVIIGLASAVVGAVLFVLFDRFYHVPPELRSAARWAFAIVVLNISAGFIGQLPYGIMSAYHDFVVRNRVQMASLVLRLGLTVGLLRLDASMIWLAVVQLSCFVFEFAVALWVVRHRYPVLRITLGSFDRGAVREIFAFSVYVLVLQVGAQLVFQTDALVIGAFLPLDRIPQFSVASSLALYLMEFVIGVGAVVMPMAASLQARNQMGELRIIYLKWSKITFSLGLFACAYLFVLGPRFLAWWIEPSFETPSGQVLRILMLANLVFLPARGVALPVLMGLGRPRAATVAFLVTGVVNLAASVALAGPLGLAGVALGTAVPNVLFALAILGLAGRELKIHPLEYAGYVVARPALALAPVAALLIWFRDGVGVRSLAGLVAAGTAALALAGVLAVGFVYRTDRYLDVATLVRKRFGAGRGS